MSCYRRISFSLWAEDPRAVTARGIGGPRRLLFLENGLGAERLARALPKARREVAPGGSMGGALDNQAGGSCLANIASNDRRVRSTMPGARARPTTKLDATGLAPISGVELNSLGLDDHAQDKLCP